jgi:hypothetical protein
MLITICRLYSDARYSATKTANVVPVRNNGASSKADGKVEGAALGAAVGATAATAASLVTMLAIPGVGARRRRRRMARGSVG